MSTHSFLITQSFVISLYKKLCYHPQPRQNQAKRSHTVRQGHLHKLDVCVCVLVCVQMCV